MNDALLQPRPLIRVLMAQNGGGATGTSRRATTAPTTTASAADIPAAWTQSPAPQITATTTTPASGQNMRDRITLVQPRPDGQRMTNYYTETPFRPAKSSTKPKAEEESPAAVHGAAGLRQANAAVSRVGRPIITTSLPLPSSRFNLVNTQRTITSQPCTFSKDKPDSTTGVDTDSGDDGHRESIICHECGRCKCEACRNPRPLPSTWICQDKCECSAEALVDLCTCMCCVKGMFYHCTDYDTDSDSSCADKPCSCHPHRRCLRWGCMSVMAIVLPCLLCYFPMRGCVKVCESCYARYSSHGCRCMQRRKVPVPHSNKRLLDPGSDC